MKFQIKNLKNAMLLIAFTILFGWGVFHFDVIMGIVKSVFGLAKPFVIGAVIAFIVWPSNPPMVSLISSSSVLRS